jgi:putative endonuclease
MAQSFWQKFFGIFATRAQKDGRQAEAAAADFLKARGFVVLERNWRPVHGHGEIDLVAREGNQLIFVEVRARKEGALVRGALTLDVHKRRTLRRTIEAYLRDLRWKHPTQALPSWRFDVIEASLRKGAPEMRHFAGTRL